MNRIPPLSQATDDDLRGRRALAAAEVLASLLDEAADAANSLQFKAEVLEDEQGRREYNLIRLELLGFLKMHERLQARRDAATTPTIDHVDENPFPF